MAWTMANKSNWAFLQVIFVSWLQNREEDVIEIPNNENQLEKFVVREVRESPDKSVCFGKALKERDMNNIVKN